MTYRHGTTIETGLIVGWWKLALIGVGLLLAASACSTEEDDGLYPDVLAVEVTVEAKGTYRFDVTMSSPYDTPQRYADAWRVIGSDGIVYGTRELLHDHASEQPFTRSLSGVEIPSQIESVTVEGRDQVSGWGGETVEVDLP